MSAEGPAAETEAKLIKIRSQILLRQTVVSTQDKGFGIADHNMQPMEHSGICDIGLMLMGIIFQSTDIASVTLIADGCPRRNGILRKAFYGSLLDIFVMLIFRYWGLTHLSRENVTKIFAFSVSLPPFPPIFGPPK